MISCAFMDNGREGKPCKEALCGLFTQCTTFYACIIFLTGVSFLLCSDKTGKLEILNELASKERIFYYQLALIWQAVLVPLLQSGKLYLY